MASLAQRIAIVTGGGSGIGQAIAVELAKYGAHVCVFDQSKKGCEDTLNMMQNDRRHLNFLGNVGTKADVDELFAYVGKEYGKPVDILVNSAGIIRDDWIWQVEEDEWDQVLRVNLKGTFLSTQAFAKQYTSQPKDASSDKSIINISSIIAKSGNRGQSNYSASKAGVIGLTKSAALDLASFGIRVNAIQPGFIQTPMTETVPPKVMQFMLQLIPLGRIGHPEDIASVAHFLASDASRYMTGNTLEVAGGLSM